MDLPLFEGKADTQSMPKLYPRPDWTAKQYGRDVDGQLIVLQTARIRIRLHVLENYLMIDRAMQMGVPRGFILDPVEKMWYLHIRYSPSEYFKKGIQDKMKIPIGSGHAKLEVSHVDHGVRGLDFLRIECKGMNICRNVNCFHNITCTKCGWQLDAKCKHTNKCQNTWWIICAKCD